MKKLVVFNIGFLIVFADFYDLQGGDFSHLEILPFFTVKKKIP